MTWPTPLFAASCVEGIISAHPARKAQGEADRLRAPTVPNLVPESAYSDSDLEYYPYGLTLVTDEILRSTCNAVPAGIRNSYQI